MNESVCRILLAVDIKGISENHRVERAGQSYCKKKYIQNTVKYKQNKTNSQQTSMVVYYCSFALETTNSTPFVAVSTCM